jgi:hypothetical protein
LGQLDPACFQQVSASPKLHHELHRLFLAASV